MKLFTQKSCKATFIFISSVPSDAFTKIFIRINISYYFKRNEEHDVPHKFLIKLIFPFK